MAKALHFGAGNIGRGFIGKIISESNYHVVFADVNEVVISALAKEKKYSVNVVGQNKQTDIVENVDGIMVNSASFADQLFDVAIITTAVGVGILPRIAGQIASIIKKRKAASIQDALHIIACENVVRGTSSILMPSVLKNLNEEEISWCESHVNFVDSAVDRIVPAVKGASNVLEVTVEEFFEWDVDRHQFKNGSIPKINGMKVVENLDAYVQRKLFTLNTGHAGTAYFGNLIGTKTIFETINIPEVEQVVLGAMVESGEVLKQRFGFPADELAEYQKKIIARFKNESIVDDVLRVGREPIRKLGKEDRLLKPLLGTIDYAVASNNLQKCIAAAFAYKNSEDEQANILQQEITQHGIEAVVNKYIGEHLGNNKTEIVNNIILNYKNFLANKKI